MKLAHYELDQTAQLSFGLNYPERVQLHAHTWLGRAGNLYNLVRGRSVLYLVWGHKIHLTEAGETVDFLARIDIASGRLTIGLKRLNIDVLGLLLRESERGKWKALRYSFRYSHA